MIITTVTLITILLFGGPDEIFLISAIEKGIKKEILDKDTQKEIKQIIGNYKNEVKSYTNLRKEQRKELNALLASQNTKRDEFESLSGGMQSILDKLQEETIDTRIEVLSMITENEWKGILKLQKKRIISEEEKASNGINKDMTEKPFSKFEQTVSAVITNEMGKQDALDQLQNVREQYIQLQYFVKDSRSEFYIIITDKNSSKEDLLSVCHRNNELRKAAYTGLMDMHQVLAKNVSGDDWPKIVKKFNKFIKG
jgi:ATP/maltotriose-dependent transcriptional regulator MalT